LYRESFDCDDRAVEDWVAIASGPVASHPAVALLAAAAVALAAAAVALQVKRQLADQTADDIENQLAALDPVTRAAVVSRLTTDAASEVKGRMNR
jgi:hypothetical protein